MFQEMMAGMCKEVSQMIQYNGDELAKNIKFVREYAKVLLSEEHEKTVENYLDGQTEMIINTRSVDDAGTNIEKLKKLAQDYGSELLKEVDQGMNLGFMENMKKASDYLSSSEDLVKKFGNDLLGYAGQLREVVGKRI